VIIDIIRCNFQRGYLPRRKGTIFHPFFATGNAAFRREALEKAGEFDLECRAGEDVDMSIRVAQAGYELWYEPSAKIWHLDRRTVGGMLLQWFGYGRARPYLYKKHTPGPRLRVYRLDLSDPAREPVGVRCLLEVPFPIYGLIFLSSFHVFHAGLLASLAAALAGARAVALGALLIGLAAGGWYVSLRFDWRRPLRSLALAGLRYGADLAFVLGALLAGLRRGVLHLEVTRSYRSRPKS
jgi:hypothetical protein